MDDGATVQILYEGKTADSAIDHKHDFDVKIDDIVMVDGGKVSAAEQEFEAVNVGDEIVRKAPSRNPAKVRHPRPTKRRWS